MAEKKWEKALEELFECFKFYQESGNFKAKNILIYVILAGILCQSQINHADSREAKVYKDDKQIIAITDLRSAYEKNNIKEIQRILNDPSNDIFRDPDFVVYLDDLLRSIRLNVIQEKVKPYRTMKLEYLAKELNITVQEVRALLSELILEKKIDAAIDQISGMVEMNNKDPIKEKKYQALEQWASTLVNLHMNLTSHNSY